MSNPKLLLVDDDRLVLATLSAGLVSHNFDVATATSGEQALAMLGENLPDLAILDMRMPGMSGIELARYLRQDGRVPFLFLSAYGDDDVVQQAAEEGALGYLVKPVDVAQMIPTVLAALARAKDIATLRTNGERLQHALTQNRETSLAVGLVMERYRLNREQAFEALRYHARSQRRKLEEVAADMILAAEQLALPDSILNKAQAAKA